MKFSTGSARAEAVQGERGHAAVVAGAGEAVRADVRDGGGDVPRRDGTVRVVAWVAVAVHLVDEAHAGADVARQLALEPRRELVVCEFVRFGSNDVDEGPPVCRDQRAFLAALPQPVAVAVGPARTCVNWSPVLVVTASARPTPGLKK
jgi:hypothetical protein